MTASKLSSYLLWANVFLFFANLACVVNAYYKGEEWHLNLLGATICFVAIVASMISKRLCKKNNFNLDGPQ